MNELYWLTRLDAANTTLLFYCNSIYFCHIRYVNDDNNEKKENKEE